MSGYEEIGGQTSEVMPPFTLEEAVAAEEQTLEWNEYVKGLSLEELMAAYPAAYRMRRDKMAPLGEYGKHDWAIMSVETSFRSRIQYFIEEDGKARKVPIVDLRGVGYADYAYFKVVDIQQALDAEDGIAA